jgi:hypothetical protein
MILSEAWPTPSLNHSYQLTERGLRAGIPRSRRIAALVIRALLWRWQVLVNDEGLVLIGIPCAFFYVKEMRPIAQGSREVRKRREIIEAAQDTAIAMTNITMQMRALAFKNAEEVAKAITLMRPMIQAAGFARVANNRVLVNTDNMAHAIVAVTGGTAKVLEDVQAALIASDPRVLRGYLKQLKAINSQLEDVLAGKYDNVPGIGTASKIIR